MKPRAFAAVTARAALALMVLLSARSASAYGVLSHEALIDATWDKGIEPTIRHRFPHVSPDDLRECRAYAYGGCIVQDMGYYPLGSKLFTDLVHYVRSDDFVEGLVHDAQDPEELAFALGALAHYCADRDGHAIGVNRVVPMAYPKLRKKFGEDVTYEQKPSAHIKVEFAFDVVHIARGKYLPKNYHDFIGFEVAAPLLGRTFHRIYGLELEEVIPDLDVAIGTYRRAASRIIPKMTEVAWEQNKDEILKQAPRTRREDYVFALARGDYEKSWGTKYRQPGPLARFLAVLVRIVPKVGPFRALAFKVPTPEENALFEKSFAAAEEMYGDALARVRSGRPLDLEPVNLDTGSPVESGAYGLADAAYGSLVVKLAAHDFREASPELLSWLRDYPRDGIPDTRQGHGHGPSRRELARALDKLASAAPVRVAQEPSRPGR